MIVSMKRKVIDEKHKNLMFVKMMWAIKEKLIKEKRGILNKKKFEMMK